MNTFKEWLADTLVRAIKTSSQSLVALLGANAFSVLHIAWEADLGVAAGAGLVSILHNIQGMPMPTFRSGRSAAEADAQAALEALAESVVPAPAPTAAAEPVQPAPEAPAAAPPVI